MFIVGFIFLNSKQSVSTAFSSASSRKKRKLAGMMTARNLLKKGSLLPFFHFHRHFENVIGRCHLAGEGQKVQDVLYIVLYRKKRTFLCTVQCARL